MTRESLARAKNASLDFVDANPRVMAIGALALGLGVGLLLPEDRLLAPTRQRFEAPVGRCTGMVEMAKATANEAMARS